MQVYERERFQMRHVTSTVNFVKTESNMLQTRKGHERTTHSSVTSDGMSSQKFFVHEPSCKSLK